MQGYTIFYHGNHGVDPKGPAIYIMNLEIIGRHPKCKSMFLVRMQDGEEFYAGGSELNIEDLSIEDHFVTAAWYYENVLGKGD